jgi:hypothetical protein
VLSSPSPASLIARLLSAAAKDAAVFFRQKSLGDCTRPLLPTQGLHRPHKKRSRTQRDSWTPNTPPCQMPVHKGVHPPPGDMGGFGGQSVCSRPAFTSA